MKDYKFKFEVDEREYNLVFNLNAMQEIQEEYGTIDNWGSLTDGKHGEVNAKALIFGLTAMINEGIEIDNEEHGTDNKLLTTKQVGRLVTKIGIEEATKKLNESIVESTKAESKNE